jgi:hypothetical protein
VKHLKDRFKHYCCQLWWWDVKELLQHYDKHFSNEHYHEKERHIKLSYCPYCGTEKPEDKHLHPFL